MKYKNYLVIVAVLFVGVGLFYLINATGPKPTKKEVKAFEPLVEIKPLQTSVLRPFWVAGGVVKGSHSVNLVAQVSGQIISVNEQAVPGATLPKNTILAIIDSQDLQLIAQQKRARLTQAIAELSIENGQAQIAEEEFKLSGAKLNDGDRSLVLRKPQISSAKAAVALAKSELDKAELDIQRAELRMPFDGQLVARNITLGSYVNSSSTTFELVETDEFWLEVKVPQSFVQWIDKDYPVEVSKPAIDNKNKRIGRILSVLPDVDSSDRQVKILIAVKDPLALKTDQVPVFYNDYAEVKIWGRDLPGVYMLGAQYLEQDNTLWVVDKNSEMQKRPVDVVYAGRHQIWAKITTEEGDQLLESRLQVTTTGMKVRTETQGLSASGDVEGAQ